MPRRTSSWLTVLQLCLSSLLLLARARVPVTEHTDQVPHPLSQLAGPRKHSNAEHKLCL